MKKLDSAITVFSFDFPPNSGGIARLLDAIAHQLADHGYLDVVLTCRKEIGLTDTSLSSCSIRTMDHRRICREIESWANLKADGTDALVLCGNWYPEGLLCWLAGVKKYIVLTHGAELLPPRQKLRRPVWRMLMRFILENAALVIANSRYTSDLAMKMAPGARVITIPLAVDHHIFIPMNRDAVRRQIGTGDKKVILSVSRLEIHKGIDTVLEAIARLNYSQRNKLIYLIAGRGPARSHLEEYAEALSVQEHLNFMGFVPDDVLPVLYNAADLFVLCPRESINNRAIEGFGLVYLEAQSCGTAVVGTETGGIPDAVEPGNGGLLIDQDDSRVLSEVLLRLIEDDRGYFRHMGRSGRKRVLCRYTWDHYWQRFHSALQSLQEG